MAAARGLVLDANILIRLVLGTKVRELVLASLDEVVFFTPAECFDDARKYLPDLLAKRGVDPAVALQVLDHFEQLIRTLDESVYAVARDEAVARIGTRDVRDWPILAVADPGLPDLDRGPRLLRHRRANLDHRPSRHLPQRRPNDLNCRECRAPRLKQVGH